MQITVIHLKLKIDDLPEKTLSFDDDKEITTESDLERYRKEIEDCFRKKYRSENPGESVTTEILFTIKG